MRCLRRESREKFQGATVVRGLGMTSPKLEALIEKEAFDRFDATKETFLVVEDDALENAHGGPR